MRIRMNFTMKCIYSMQLNLVELFIMQKKMRLNRHCGVNLLRYFVIILPILISKIGWKKKGNFMLNI